jgi:phosphate transport system permease protein
MDASLLFLCTAIASAIVAFLAYRSSYHRFCVLADGGEELASTPDYYGWLTVALMFAVPLAVTVLAAVGNRTGATAIPGIWVAAAWIVIPVLLFLPVIKRIKPTLNARIPVERLIYAILLVAALISIGATIGIFLSVLFESIQFFSHPGVTLSGFLFGTNWSPGDAFLESMGRASGASNTSSFGAVPLFAGTFLITALAMLVAVPIGVMTAIFLSEYASPSLRRSAKPVIEMLAGIPTVVYGFFAAITVAPYLVDFGEMIGLDPSYQNALAPGLIMGVMIIPFMSSLCDDVIRAVPQNLRRAGYALGATPSETITQIVLPAALPGIISAFLLSVSRAIGETMIVVMAAGLTANLTANPFSEVTTVTVQIVDNLTGDQAYDNPQTLSAFGLGLTLLIMTLALNIVSLVVVRRFRQSYEAD